MAQSDIRDYYLPASRQEAVELMRRFGDGAMLVAGGTFVHGLEVRGLLENVVALIDIGRLGLRGIARDADGTVTLGATSTFADLANAKFVREDPAYGAIADALTYPPPQIRNVGTVGGCIAAAAPLYDLPAALLALDARVRTTSGAGERELALADLFVGLFANSLAPDELITAIVLPAASPRTAGAFLKLESNANDLAVVNVAVRVTQDARGICRDSRIVVGGGIGEQYVRAPAAEAALNGKTATAESIGGSAALVAGAIEPVSDHRGSAAYRRRIAEVYTRRALTSALKRLA